MLCHWHLGRAAEAAETGQFLLETDPQEQALALAAWKQALKEYRDAPARQETQESPASPAGV
jgi:hypothetical protein